MRNIVITGLRQAGNENIVITGLRQAGNEKHRDHRPETSRK